MSDPIPTDDHPHARRREIEARVRRHLPLVFRTALRHWERLGRRVDYAELVEEGALAILRAAERHDERRASFRAAGLPSEIRQIAAAALPLYFCSREIRLEVSQRLPPMPWTSE